MCQGPVDRRLAQPPLLWVLSSRRCAGTGFLFVVVVFGYLLGCRSYCVSPVVSAAASAGVTCLKFGKRRSGKSSKRVEACSQTPARRGCGSRKPRRENSSGAGAKPEQPVCEQAVAFTLSGLHSGGMGWVLWTFPLLSSRRIFFLQRAICYPHAPSLSVRLHYDLFGSLKRNEHPQSTDRVLCAQRRFRGCAVPKFSSCQGYLIGKDPPDSL